MKSKIDWLLTFGWFWALREQFAHRRLERVLEKFGDDSFEGRNATTRYRRAHVANRYGRPLDPRVLSHIEALRRNGIPIADLRILIVNNVFLPLQDSVGLRNDLNYSTDRWVGWIMTIFGGLVLFLSATCASHQVQPSFSALLGVGIVVAGYYFLSLYSIQLYNVLSRHKYLLA